MNVLSEIESQTKASVKQAELIEYISGYRTALVALSGGLDSCLVLWVTVKALGSANTLAVTSRSASLPSSEIAEIEEFNRQIGLDPARHRFVLTREMEVAGYYQNSSERCYFCKNELYGDLEKIRIEENLDVVFDGANLSDLGDVRPGQRAAKEQAVVSPLLACKIDKPTARAIAREIGLTVAEKPASACLSSRIPHGVTITTEILAQIDKAESALKNLGFSGFRVRYHNELARLELEESDMSKISDDKLRAEVVSAIKGAGFRFVSVDLEGYRQGSMNLVTSKAQKA